MSTQGIAGKRVSWNLPQARQPPSEVRTLAVRFEHQRSRSEGDITRVHPGWIRSALTPSPRGGQIAASHRPPVPTCLQGVLAREQASPRQPAVERAQTLLAGAIASIACRFMIEHPVAIDTQVESYHFQSVCEKSPGELHKELRAAVEWIERDCGVRINGPTRLQEIAEAREGTQGQYVEALLELANEKVDWLRRRPVSSPRRTDTL